MTKIVAQTSIPVVKVKYMLVLFLCVKARSRINPFIILSPQLMCLYCLNITSHLMYRLYLSYTSTSCSKYI